MSFHQNFHLFKSYWTLFVNFHNPKNYKLYGYIINSIRKEKSIESYYITKVNENATRESIK